jgi:hypothetical protein
MLRLVVLSQTAVDNIAEVLALLQALLFSLPPFSFLHNNNNIHIMYIDFKIVYDVWI